MVAHGDADSARAELARWEEMWDRSMMPRVARGLGGHILMALLVGAVLVLSPAPAWAWIENHVQGLQTRLTIDASGQTVVEHRLELRMNGNVRQKTYRIDGVDADAEPLPDGYVVPFDDALAGSTEEAIPIVVAVRKHDDEPTVSLDVKVEDRKGLWRGRYLFVIRYRTDLREGARVTRDGALVQLRWQGPRLADGYDNARTTFVVPASPSPPRAPDADEHDPVDDRRATREGSVEGSLPATFLSEVRRGQDHDEIELLRTYAPKGEGILWTVRVDPRAVTPPPMEGGGAAAEPAFRTVRDEMATRNQWLGLAAGVLLLLFLLGWGRGREVARLADEAGARVPPLVPMPPILRGLGAGLGVVAGLALQLRFDRPVLGALAVIVGVVLLAHGVPRLSSDAARRGPGRWLTVTEREALGPPPRRAGAWLDSSTRVGKGLLLLVLAAHAGGVWWLAQHSRLLALQAGFDAVIWLALFGTGRLVTMPPDMAVEPAGFLRKVAKRLRKGDSKLRIAPRIRIPHGEVDPDELRLGVVPKLPLRGFSGIEVGVTYALGFGPRVAMPEILVRVVSGSPCDEALAVVSTKGRISPGRKPDERVIAITPRFPTAKMTAEIVIALAARVTDPQRAERQAEPAEPKKRKRRRRRPRAAAREQDEAAA